MSSSNRLQLNLSAKNLKNLAGAMSLRNIGGVFETSDPFAVVTIRGDDPDNPPVIVGETEVNYNNLNPHWATVVFLEGYKFGVPFYIDVGVFDFNARHIGKSEDKLSEESSDKSRLSTASSRNLLRLQKLPHKVMGTALFEVGEILGARGNIASKSLQTGGVLYCHIERSREDGAHGLMRYQLRGMNFQNTQSLGFTSSPYFELYRKVDSPSGATWQMVYKSNVIKHNLYPKWDETNMSLEAACNGDLNRAMKIVVKDHRRRGRHKEMGEFETSMQGFIDCKNDGGDIDEERAFALMKGDKKVGNVLVTQASLLQQQEESAAASVACDAKRRPEFVDYLTGGCQISLAIAIDFTASNGDPGKEGTPHHFYPASSKKWNDYQKAIYAVGSILAKYDSDGLMPTWGFGAKYGKQVLQCFQCGGDVEVKGVNGVMEAYRGVFNTKLTMSYPTDFTEVIKTASKYAQHEQMEAEKEGKLSYTILLILTAGNIENVGETKHELIEASGSPLSIVIVGIGEGDGDGAGEGKPFESMKFLDEHDPSTEEGRDITKFVHFRDYKSYNLLTEAVLDEIPDQLVDYYYQKDIMPGKAESVDREDVAVMPADDDDRTVNFLGSD